MKRILFALALLAAHPAIASVKDGVAKWRAGDHKGAVTEWLPQAARGDADAMFNLGQAYRLGRGVVADVATAHTYFLKAAIKGHGPAQERLGLSLLAKPDTKAEGIRWLTQAAAQDEARAQYALGVAYFNGEGVTPNRSLAFAYMRRAEKNGMAEATPALAAMMAKLTPPEKARGDQLALALPTAAQGVVAAQPAAATPAVAPSPAAAATPPVAVPAPGYRVQIGAFDNRDLATKTWLGLTAREKKAIGDAPPIYAERADFVRLQVGPFPTRDEAKQLCSRLSAAGRSCFVVGS